MENNEKYILKNGDIKVDTQELMWLLQIMEKWQRERSSLATEQLQTTYIHQGDTWEEVPETEAELQYLDYFKNKYIKMNDLRQRERIGFQAMKMIENGDKFYDEKTKQLAKELYVENKTEREELQANLSEKQGTVLENMFYWETHQDIQSIQPTQPTKEVTHGEEIRAIRDSTVNQIDVSDKSKKPKDIILERLEQEVKGFMDSKRFADFCKTSAMHFAGKSFSNAVLIFAQKPSATYVAGYEQWKDYGRQPKGEGTGIRILAPVFVHETEKGNLLKSLKTTINKQLSLDKNLNVAVANIGSTSIAVKGYKNGLYDLTHKDKTVQANMTEEQLRHFLDRNIIGKVPAYYKPVVVYDVDNTIQPEYLWLKKGTFKKSELALDEKGQPVTNKKGEYKCYNTDERKAKFVDTRDLKSITKNEQKAEILLQAIKQLNQNRGIPLSLENINNGSRGFYSQTVSSDDKGRIAISQELDIADKVKTAIHETTHSQLHSKEEIANTANAIGKSVSDVSRRDKELQAEATAYLVCQHYGIDSSDYSFNYLASWSADRNIEDLHKSLNVVWNQSRKLLTDLKEELNKMGFDENIEPIHNVPSEHEKKQFIADEKDYIFKTGEFIDSSLSEAKSDLAIVQDERQKNIIREQVDILIHQNELLHQMNEHLESYSGTVSEQKLIQANKDKINVLSKKFDELSAERIERIQELQENQKAEIKDLYTKEPYKAIKLLQESNSLLQKLSDSEIKCIAISPYLKGKFGRDIENEKFVVNASLQISNSKEVMAKNGIFVEVNWCEHWDNNISFTDGAVLHPSTANKMIKEADDKVHQLKDIAEKNDEYYPYVKLSLTVYKIDKDDVQAVKMRIDLGGENHSQDLKSALNYELGNQPNAQTFLRECEKAISENVKNLYREAVPIDIDTQSISDWERDIKAEKEIDISENEEHEQNIEQQGYEDIELPDISTTGED